MAGNVVRGTVAVLIAGAATALLGAGSASAATTAPAAAPAPAVSAAQPWRWVDCDDWRNRWNRDCYQNTRWYWHGDDRGHGRWDHWQNNGRGHWDYRGDDDRGYRR